MAVLRYFHQDPRQTSVQESSVIDKQGTVLTQKLTTINQSITNNTQVLEDKLNSVPGKSLSTNDFTDEYKNKLRGIEEGAEVNVQSDWGEDDNTADSYIKNKPVIDDIVTQNSENLITSGAVFTAIDELPEPMIFKGSLGTGGTIQTLPAPSADNVGFVYKVITAGAYYGITAKPGDSFISDGSDWILIPSGDEPEGTVMSVGLTVPTGLLVSGSPITTSGTLAITYALGYAIPTTAKLDEWDAKQDAISDLSTIRTNASNGNTAYGWGNHANAGYLAAISDLATIRSNASEGHTAYGWGNHANAGYVKSSGVTSVAMTVPTGLSISGSPITSTGTLALSFTNGYSIPTTAKQSNWDTAYGWGNHASAGYVKSSGVTSVKMTVPTGFSITGSPITSTGTLALAFASGYSLPTTAKLSNWDTAYGWGNHANAGYLTQHLSLAGYLPLSGGTMTGNISFSNSGTGFRGINYGTMGDNDQWRIGGAATGSNAGYMEIATADDGNEPIYVRLYTGVFATLKRTLTLLDASGNTSMPGSVTAGSFVKSGGTSSLFLKADGSVDSNTYATSSSLGNYLPLTGGTLSNGNWGLQLTLKRQGGTPSLYFNDGTYSYYFYPTMSKDNEWHVGLTYNNKDYILWHNGNFNPANYLPLTGGTLSGDLNVRNSKIWIQSNSEAGSNSNRLTTSAGMPGNMQYNTSRRGTQIYSNGIAFADPYNGNSNNDAAWIRHLETTGNAGLLEIAVGDDASNEEIRFRRYNTSNNIASDVLVPNTTGTLALTSQIPTNLNQLTNGPGYITGITKTMVTNALGYTPPTTDTNTWRGITDSYSGTDSSISLSQKGGKALYDALVNGYANSAGNADTVDSFHVDNSGNGPTWGRLTPVKSDGVLEVGKYIDFHNTSNDGKDYATRVLVTQHSGNSVNLPTASGTLALTSQIPTNVSQLTNDSGYITSSPLGNYLLRNTAGGIASVSGNGLNWWFKIATIKIVNSYINRPIVFEISLRGFEFSILLVLFQNANNTDPGLGSFTTNNVQAYYIRHTGAGTWEIYGKYSETWGFAVIHRVTGCGADIGVTINMQNAGTTQPTDLELCTTSGNVHYASVAGSVLWSGVSGRPTNLNLFTNGPGYITSSSLGSYLPKNGSDYATWLRVVNNSSNNNDDALVFILNKSNNDWALKVDCTGYNYGINVITSDNASHAIYTNGRISCYSLKFMNTANVASGWNIYTEDYGLRILDDTGHSDRGAPSNYYATGLHVGGQYWFLLAFERGRNTLLFRGGNAEGVTTGGWLRIATFVEDSNYAAMYVRDKNGNNDFLAMSYGSTGAAGSEVFYLGTDSRNVYLRGRDVYIKADNYLSIFCNNNGNVSIGNNTNPSYKLHVQGACAATSFPNTSDIRLKDIQLEWSPKLEDIANAPSFLFKWKNSEDDIVHLGTSAQYWEEKVPLVVTEADDEIGTKSLLYDVLGAVNSIAIAKEVVSLKEEIKLLQALIAELKLLLNN